MRLLKFGGAYSNHLVAVAAIGRRLGIETIGVVRGELNEPLNTRLSFAVSCGMHLYAVSRADYRHKASEQTLSRLRATYGDFYCIPEGGSNTLGVRGCEEISDFLTWESSAKKRLVALACGTGSTMAGLIRGLTQRRALNIEVVGISVINAPGVMERAVFCWLHEDGESCRIVRRTIDDCHFGGYAKTSPELSEFVAQYSGLHDIPLEPVYSGKLFWLLNREL